MLPIKILVVKIEPVAPVENSQAENSWGPQLKKCYTFEKPRNMLYSLGGFVARISSTQCLIEFSTFIKLLGPWTLATLLSVGVYTPLQPGCSPIV